MQERIFDGKGKQVFSDGSVYTGSWKDGHESGQGTFTYVSGYKQSGMWKNDSFMG